MSASTTYKSPRAAALGNVTAETVFLNALAPTTAACVCYIPGNGEADGKPLTITVAGKATGGTTTTLTVALYQGSSTTVGSNTVLATTGAKNINSANGNFMLQFRGMVDTTSGILIGTVSGYLNATAVTGAISSAVTGLTPAGAAIPLCVTAIFGSGNAGNTISITSFTVAIDD